MQKGLRARSKDPLHHAVILPDINLGDNISDIWKGKRESVSSIGIQNGDPRISYGLYTLKPIAGGSSSTTGRLSYDTLSHAEIMESGPKRVLSYCTADAYQLQPWQENWKEFCTIWLTLYPDSCIQRWDDTLVYLYLPSSNGHLFLFTYGVIVCWGLGIRQERAVLALCSQLEQQSQETPETEEFTYEIITKSDSSYVLANRIVLKSDQLEFKILLSHALAQSIKLKVFEKWMDQSVALIHSLKLFQKGGHISRHRLTQSIGQFYDFLIKMHSRIHVFGKSPEFLWHLPTSLLPFYQCFHTYLEIGQRTDALKSKAVVLSDTLAMLRGHINNHHSMLLLRIIIIVIFLSVLITVVRIIVEHSL
jgi:uncharacterized Rmd1/YagE family protein